MRVVFVVFLALIGLGFAGLVVVLIAMGVAAVRERRSWRGPGLTAAERTRPAAELQDAAGAEGAPVGEDGALAAWNMAQFKNQQAGSGQGIGPF